MSIHICVTMTMTATVQKTIYQKIFDKNIIKEKKILFFKYDSIVKKRYKRRKAVIAAEMKVPDNINKDFCIQGEIIDKINYDPKRGGVIIYLKDEYFESDEYYEDDDHKNCDETIDEYLEDGYKIIFNSGYVFKYKKNYGYGFEGCKGYNEFENILEEIK